MLVKTISCGWRFYAAFGCLSLINLIYALTTTSLVVALLIIAENLYTSSIKAFWAGISFLLTSTKLVLLLALTLFTIRAIITAIPSNFTGGGISALTYVIITNIVRLKERGKWFGLITIIWAFGNVIGPILRGLLAEERWIFWLNIPFYLISFLIILFFLKFKPKDGKISNKIRQTDWRTVVPLILSVFGFLSFILWLKYMLYKPILYSSMFRDSISLITYFTIIIYSIFLLLVLYYIVSFPSIPIVARDLIYCQLLYFKVSISLVSSLGLGILYLAIRVGVIGVIFQNKVKKHLDISTLVEVIRRMLIEEDSIKRELVMAYMDSIVFIASLFIKKRSLERGVDID
ncbi:MFS general substrate transporter [Cenococcum geophilum]